VPQIHWPAMVALAQTQRSPLYVVARDADGTPVLRPLSLPGA